MATTVGEAEVRVRRRRLAGPAAGGVAVVEREGVARVEGQGEHAEAAVTMAVVVATTAAAGSGSGCRSGEDGDKGTVLTLGGGGWGAVRRSGGGRIGRREEGTGWG